MMIGLDGTLFYFLSAEVSENGTLEFVWKGAGYVGP